MQPDDFPMKQMKWPPRPSGEPAIPDDWQPMRTLELNIATASIKTKRWITVLHTHTPGLYRVWEDIPVTFDQNLYLLAEIATQTRVCVYGNPATGIAEMGVHDSLNIHPQFATHWHYRFEVVDWDYFMTLLEECYVS